jgi:uncharacterized membrane protein YjfL (UPF0719 family)
MWGHQIFRFFFFWLTPQHVINLCFSFHTIRFPNPKKKEKIKNNEVTKSFLTYPHRLLYLEDEII